MTRTLEADVLVVGAGLAGLAAARELAAAGREVAVLEARERVGGRTLDADLGEGKVVELGGQWIGPTQDRVEALARELGIEAFESFGEGESVIEIGGVRRRYSGTVPRLGPHVLADVELVRRSLERLARRVPLAAPWEAPDARRLDGQTLASWLARHARTRAARRLVALAAKTVWGAEPAELSLLHVAFYVRSAGGLFMLLDTEGGAQERRFHGGSQRLSLELAARLGPERVLLGAPVRRIEHSRERVTVHAGGVAATARRAVVAVPPNLAGRIAYDPPLPGARDQLTQRTAQGALAKCLAVYDEPFWRADGLSGEAVRDSGPVTLTFDDSPPDGRPGVLLGFAGGDHARALSRRPPEERRSAVLNAFAALFGARARRPERYLEQNWMDEPWSGGGPVALMPTGAWTGFGHALREPIGSLHWAGAETAIRWCGYLDGAVRSGERAAREALEMWEG